MNIELFGNLKKYGKSLAVDLSSGATVSEAKSAIKCALKERFSDSFQEVLIDRAVIATKSRVLGGGEIIPLNEELSILPPVCGG